VDQATITFHRALIRVLKTVAAEWEKWLAARIEATNK
jgi:hypothetical protein